MSARERELATRTARGFLWALAGAVGGRIFSVVALAVVARILAPEQFGLFAFALVYVTYLNTVGDLGVGMALIYWRERVRDAAQITFAVNVLAGLTWFAITVAVAPAVASFFHSPEGTSILRALAWLFVIRGLGNTHDALCRKELRFRDRVAPELGLSVVKAIFMVGFAIAGFGVWSLVWGQLAGMAAWTVALWIVMPWRPEWRWPTELFLPMLRYGREIVAVNVIAAVVHHADYIVVGRMLGMEALGHYQIAYKVPEMAVILVLWQVNTVLFPAFSRVHAAGDDMATAYTEALRYVGLVILPASAGLFFLAEPIVLTIFGDQWVPAVPILRALALYVAFRALGSHAGDVLKASGRPGLLAAIGLGRAAVLVPALVVAGGIGASEVALTMAAVAAASLPVMVGFLRHVTGVRIRDVVACLRDGVFSTGVLVVFLIGWTTLIRDAAGAVYLVASVIAGALVYALAVRFLAPEALRRALRSLRGSDGLDVPAARAPAEGGEG